MLSHMPTHNTDHTRRSLCMCNAYLCDGVTAPVTIRHKVEKYHVPVISQVPLPFKADNSNVGNASASAEIDMVSLNELFHNDIYCY